MNGNKKAQKGHSHLRLVYKSDWILFLLISLGFGIGLYFLPYLPDQIAPHFSQGEPTRYEPKLFMIIIIPIICIVMVFFMNVVLWIANKLDLNIQEMDEQQKAKEKVKTARLFMYIKYITILVFLLGPYFYIIYWNLTDIKPDPQRIHLFIAFLFSVFYISLGIWLYRSNMMPNLSFGNEKPSVKVIRTFNKRLGISFFIAGVIALSTSLLPADMMLPVLLISILLSPLVGFIWAYIKGNEAYQKESSSSKKDR